MPEKKTIFPPLFPFPFPFPASRMPAHIGGISCEVSRKFLVKGMILVKIVSNSLYSVPPPHRLFPPRKIFISLMQTFEVKKGGWLAWLGLFQRSGSIWALSVLVATATSASSPLMSPPWWGIWVGGFITAPCSDEPEKFTDCGCPVPKFYKPV